MAATFGWKFLSILLLLALTPFGCGATNQDLRQEIRDDLRGTREQMSQREKAYEKREDFGLTSKDSKDWNSTDWSLWMDSRGGGH